MDNLITGQLVYFLMPDSSVVSGKITDERSYDQIGIEMNDGMKILFFRSPKDIYNNEKDARAMKFLKRFRRDMNHGSSVDEAFSSEDDEIVEMAIDKWPEKLI